MVITMINSTNFLLNIFVNMLQDVDWYPTEDGAKTDLFKISRS